LTGSALKIALVPIGEVDHGILERLREDIPTIFTADIEAFPAVPLRVGHFVKSRGQYTADEILDDFASIVPGEGTVFLGVTEADIYSPGLNFVFGIANRGRALISTFRLRPEFYGHAREPDASLIRHQSPGPGGREGNTAVFRRRVLVEAVHEIGHALGLSHCEYPGCVMYFSNRIGDSDRKGPGFCFRCARALERLMAG